MKPMYVIAAILVTMICWGIYGPVLHPGQVAFADGNKPGLDDGLRAFICVGIAYFLIAIVFPVTMLKMYGESGEWTTGGVFWSLIAGAIGAIGALGVILAFGFGGRPVFVMPLIFGGAPVVNSFLTMYWSKSLKQFSPIFTAGLVMVALGAVTVLLTRPRHHGGSSLVAEGEWGAILWVIAAVAVVILCWGAYGPVLHRGQMKMSGSRLRPLICVGLAYFLIAVVVPGLILSGSTNDGSFNSFSGVMWSLFAGTAGALGALGVIYAFNFGGKPIYVMPLVFGGAPVVNTAVSVIKAGEGAPDSPLFYAGLILVAAGAVMVLVFAPKGHGPPQAAAPSGDDSSAGDSGASESRPVSGGAAGSDSIDSAGNEST